MSETQCWSVQGDGSRCVGFAQPGSFFCSRHRCVRTSEVSRIWRAPEAEMPRELVAGLRRAAPEITFPAPEVAPSSDAVPSARSAGQQRSGDPMSTPGGGGVQGPSDRTERTDRTEASSAAPSLAEAGPTPPAALLPGEPAGSPPLDWLMAILQEATEGVMGGDATPLQKANAVARLAGHYLKACRAKELERENKELARRVSAAEARVAELERRLAAAAEGPREVRDEPAAALAVTWPEPAGSLATPGREERSPPVSVAEEVMIRLDSGEAPGRAAGVHPALLTAGGREGAWDPP